MAVSHNRRSNGEGSVYRTAEGRWRASLILSHPDGDQRVRRVVSGRSRAEVVRKLGALRLEAECRLRQRRNDRRLPGPLDRGCPAATAPGHTPRVRPPRSDLLRPTSRRAADGPHSRPRRARHGRYDGSWPIPDDGGPHPRHLAACPPRRPARRAGEPQRRQPGPTATRDPARDAPSHRRPGSGDDRRHPRRRAGATVGAGSRVRAEARRAAGAGLDGYRPGPARGPAGDGPRRRWRLGTGRA